MSRQGRWRLWASAAFALVVAAGWSAGDLRAQEAAPLPRGGIGLANLRDIVSGSTAATENGSVWIDHDWTTVNLTEPFTDPIVVAGPATSLGWQPGVVRVRNVTPSSFQIRFQEWDYLDGWHCPELVAWFALDRGTFDVGGGTYLCADSFSTNKTNVYSPQWVSFPVVYSEPPVVIAQIQTAAGADAVTDRICGVYASGMHYSMQEQQSKGGHCYEEAGYIVCPQAWPFMRKTPTAATHRPFLLATAYGQGVGYIREEQSADWETNHWAAEQVGILTPLQPPYVIADLQTCNGTDPCDLRCTQLSQVYKQENFTVNVNHQWQTVTLWNTYVDPVVYAGPATYWGLDPGEIRVRNVTPTSFQIRFQEWDYLDGWHCNEEVHWSVMERGIWQASGNMAIYDEFRLSNANVHSPASVPFPWLFTSTTVDYVIATQQTANGPSAVTERISHIQPAGFKVALQEEEAADGIHAEENLGYVAFGPGSGGLHLGGPGVGAEAQLFGEPGASGPDPRLTLVFYIVEERSWDLETWHCAEVIGGPTPIAIRDMQTCNGTDPCSLRWDIVSAPRRDVEASDALELAASVLCPLAQLSECSPVTLRAPASTFDGTRLLVFSHWLVNGVPQEPGELTIQVESAAAAHAVAVYVPAE